MSKYWTFDDNVDLALYADLGGLFSSSLGQSFLPVALGLAKGAMSPDQAKCLHDFVAAAREVLLAGSDDSGMVILRFDEGVSKPDACLATLDARPAKLDGATDAYLINDSYLVHLPGIILTGKKQTLVDALAQRTNHPVSPTLRLGDDQYLAWNARPDADIRLSGRLLLSAARFTADVDADLPAGLAASVEPQVAHWKGVAPDFGKSVGLGADWQRLVDAIVVERHGNHIHGAFELREPPMDQVRDLGTLATVGIYGVRKYIANAKAAEAKNTVGQIAKDYATYWESEPPPGKSRPKKLVSFPPVPSSVPRAVKYQSSRADWKPWDALRFEMDTPQYYQYEVKAAKDGQSADILARGDLNGDGKTSLFKLHIELDPKSHQLRLSPNIAETDPEE